MKLLARGLLLFTSAVLLTLDSAPALVLSTVAGISPSQLTETVTIITPRTSTIESLRFVNAEAI